MNKVIYFTNALDQNSFTDYLKNWKVSPNLSNQNFHHKLIKALGLYFDVDVVSIRAINSNYAKAKLDASEYIDNNIHWLYPKVSVNRVAKALLLGTRIKKVLAIDNTQVIFVDALNYSLVKEAYKLAKRNKSKIIGICTDNPYNISFTSGLYNKNLMKYATKLDGYIVLTEGINKVFNTGNKLYLLIDGVSEDNIETTKPLINDKYIYFGGSLMEEYGIYNLIEAFNELNLKDIKLVICGHHVQKDKLLSKINNNKNIIYLGPVNYFDNLSLERNALLSVNPRPINKKIDDYSIPSKTLECLSMRCLNVTVDNKLLKENYEDCIIWANSSSVEDLKHAIKRSLELSDSEKKQIVESGYKKVMLRTSQTVIGKEIENFLSKFFLN